MSVAPPLCYVHGRLKRTHAVCTCGRDGLDSMEYLRAAAKKVDENPELKAIHERRMESEKFFAEKDKPPEEKKIPMSEFQLSNLGPLEDYDEKEVETQLALVLEDMKKLQSLKGASYGDSWQEHGEAISIFGNVSRKYSRLKKMVLHGAKGTSDEAKIDTVADLAVYGMLWTTYLSMKDPDAYKAWRKRNGLTDGE